MPGASGFGKSCLDYVCERRDREFAGDGSGTSKPGKMQHVSPGRDLCVGKEDVIDWGIASFSPCWI
eukprot:1286119-Pyramimonas_sp.AAC.2